jgi:uncharacterized protein YecT (DUF1311 family)
MVYKRRFFISVILLCVLSHPFFALAIEKESDGFCEEAFTVVEIRLCLSQRLEKAEALMQSSLKLLRSRLTSDQRAYLYRAQKAWLVYRDHSAVFVASSEEGGTLNAVEQLVVRTEMTEKRIGELEELLLRFGKMEFK